MLGSGPIQGGKRTTKLDKQSSSHLWIRSVTTQTKRNLMMITWFLGKFITKTFWKHNQDAIYYIEEPTSFLDHVYMGCNQRECKPNEKINETMQKMFESRISAGATEN